MFIRNLYRSGGAGTVIGICDTGLRTDLPGFQKTQLIYREFGLASPRHGTHVASTILQFAPKAQLVFAGGIIEGYAKLECMLEWLSHFDLDVLNLSLAFPKRDPQIHTILQELYRQGTLIVGAKASGDRPFPWSEEYTISAGRGGDFDAPEAWVATSATGHQAIMRGSSVATALTTGMVALYKSLIPNLSREQFLAQADPRNLVPPPTPKRQENLQI